MDADKDNDDDETISEDNPIAVELNREILCQVGRIVVVVVVVVVAIVVNND